MNEFEIISKYFSPLTNNFPGALNLKDDACLLQQNTNSSLVVTKDVLASGTHFFESDKAEDVAHKLISVNVSDLAAMGAKPLVYFLGLALPKTIDNKWIKYFSQGIKDSIKMYGGVIAGGDTTSHNGKLVLSLTAIGQSENNIVLKRSTAKLNEDIYVSGTIGDAYIGLCMLQNKTPKKSGPILRYHRPTARIELGLKLTTIASSCIDISDGLVADLEHICKSSDVGAQINIDKILFSPNAPDNLKTKMITAGDDYELLFTAQSSKENEILKLSKQLNIPITKIGHITGDKKITIKDNNNINIEIDKKGFNHFS